MKTVLVKDYGEWLTQAGCLLPRYSPDQILWTDEQQSSLFGDDSPDLTGLEPESLPDALRDLVEAAACHRDSGRWTLLYRVWWRLTRKDPVLLERVTDPDLQRLHALAREVARDCHNMKAYVRFRETPEGFVAWHRPDHLVVQRMAPFFVRRFRAMQWAILTPDECAYWDKDQLRFGRGLPRSAAPRSDELEALWKTYYRSTFNPARVNPRAMQREMPKKHWSTMPETAEIADLLRSAQLRVDRMAE